MRRHQIWLWDSEGWSKLGAPVTERTAVKTVVALRCEGERAKALPEGVEPESEFANAT